MSYTYLEIKLAAQMMKVLPLVAVSDTEISAVRLNCGLTLAEENHAMAWNHAFDIAKHGDGDLFERAMALREATK